MTTDFLVPLTSAPEARRSRRALCEVSGPRLSGLGLSGMEGVVLPPEDKGGHCRSLLDRGGCEAPSKSLALPGTPGARLSTESPCPDHPGILWPPPGPLPAQGNTDAFPRAGTERLVPEPLSRRQVRPISHVSPEMGGRPRAALAARFQPLSPLRWGGRPAGPAPAQSSRGK